VKNVLWRIFLFIWFFSKSNQVDDGVKIDVEKAERNNISVGGDVEECDFGGNGSQRGVAKSDIEDGRES